MMADRAPNKPKRPNAGIIHARRTQLLRAWSEGEQRALEKLIPVVYDELHRMAER